MALWGKQDAATPTGTSIDVTSGSAAVTGTGTTFLADIDAGDTLIIGTTKYKVLSVTSNTALTLTSNYEGSTATLTISSEPVRVQQSPKHLSLADKRNTYGVDATEAQAGGDNVVDVNLVSGGSRYLETPAVTFASGSATANASIAGGAVTSFVVTSGGSSYSSVPAVTVAKPKRTVLTTGVNTDEEKITYTGHNLISGEEVKYYHGGGTAIAGLTDGTSYYISALGLGADTFRLAASSGAAALRNPLTTLAISGTGGQFTCAATTLAAGDRVVISGTIGGTGDIVGWTSGTIYKVSAVTGTSPSVTGFTLTAEDGSAITTVAGTTTGLTARAATIVNLTGTGNNAQYFEIQEAAAQATAVAELGSGEPGAIPSPGWVLRTEGTGGRAGRVQYETLVAGRSLITGDAADDIEFPDS